MEPFAVSLARAGYVAVSYDLRGHGRNPEPMTGDILREDGATLVLLTQLQAVIALARTLPGTDGRVAVLGHSMAADIIARAAIADPGIAATVAVSMFSPVITADAPRDLLMIVGGWEGPLLEENLRVLRLLAGPEAEPGGTYTAPEDPSNRRRLSVSPSVEHVGVLFSRSSLVAAQGWLDMAFGRSAPSDPDMRGPWLGLLLAGVVALGWPLARALPRCPPADPPRSLPRGRLLAAIALPALATPLILRPLPTDFLPVLVADYLAAHFALYGLLTAAMLAWAGARPRRLPSPRALAAGALAAAFAVAAPALAIDAFAASFLPQPGRIPLILALAAGTLAWSFTDAWTARRPGAPWWGHLAARAALLVSLALAVALDFERLFFLLIITPVILLGFVVYGLYGRWIAGATGNPTPAGLAEGAAFAWALGVTFPLVG